MPHSSTRPVRFRSAAWKNSAAAFLRPTCRTTCATWSRSRHSPKTLPVTIRIWQASLIAASISFSVRIIRPSTNAVLVEAGDRQHWIPLSLIHGADELTVRMSDPGDTLALRIMDWKVDALGIIPQRATTLARPTR